MNRLLMATALATIPMAAAVAQAPMSSITYVMKAGASDQYEIQSSKLVLQTTHNQKIRDFANMMVTDHMKSTADVKAAAMDAGMHPAPAKLDGTGLKDLAALRVAKGGMRDTLYVNQQKASHQRALMLQQGYAETGTTPQLKATAAAIAPVVQTHITELDGM